MQLKLLEVRSVYFPHNSNLGLHSPLELLNLLTLGCHTLHKLVLILPQQENCYIWLHVASETSRQRECTMV
jgi:hypothetical protein